MKKLLKHFKVLRNKKKRYKTNYLKYKTKPQHLTKTSKKITNINKDLQKKFVMNTEISL